MKSIELDAAFYYSIEIDDDAEISLPFIRSLFEEIAREDNAHRLFSDLRIEEEPEVISVFHSYNKFRILHECKLYNDRAKYVINDDHDHFPKDELYRMAFTDPITGHYNWSHLVAFLEMPGNREIYDYAFAHLT